MKFPDKATICTSLKNEDVVIHYTFFPNHFFGFFFCGSIYVLYVILQLNVYFLVGGSVLCMNNTCVCVHINVVSMI